VRSRLDLRIANQSRKSKFVHGIQKRRARALHQMPAISDMDGIGQGIPCRLRGWLHQAGAGFSRSSHARQKSGAAELKSPAQTTR